jgi:hypothetical protein
LARQRLTAFALVLAHYAKALCYSMDKCPEHRLPRLPEASLVRYHHRTLDDRRRIASVVYAIAVVVAARIGHVGATVFGNRDAIAVRIITVWGRVADVANPVFIDIFLFWV